MSREYPCMTLFAPLASVIPKVSFSKHLDIIHSMYQNETMTAQSGVKLI